MNPRLIKLNKDSFVVDLGAYEGEFTKFILKKYKCRVDAYEPLKDVFNVQHKKLKFINKAVYDGSEVGINIKNGSDSSIVKKGRKKIKTIDIREITKEPIDLLKMNIEGAEIEILKIIDLNNVNQLLIEFHLFIGKRFNPPITQKVVDKAIERIMSFGFKAIKLPDNSPSYFFTKL
jgi:FkbM family methyltransferase